ncbi:hypothetical protein ABBQ32_012640 [Trebouxia sp. C0010 RCD-2024]
MNPLPSFSNKKFVTFVPFFTPLNNKFVPFVRFVPFIRFVHFIRFVPFARFVPFIRFVHFIRFVPFVPHARIVPFVPFVSVVPYAKLAIFIELARFNVSGSDKNSFVRSKMLLCSGGASSKALRLNSAFVRVFISREGTSSMCLLAAHSKGKEAFIFQI